MVQAYAYWRLKGLTTDLVIWNDEQGGYRQQLHDQIMGLISAGVEANVIDRPGGVFVRPAPPQPLPGAMPSARSITPSAPLSQRMNAPRPKSTNGTSTSP